MPTHCNTGETNRRIQELAGNDKLATICDATALTGLINLSPTDRSVGFKTKTATVEAMVGAAYKHGGIVCATQVMQALRII